MKSLGRILSTVTACAVTLGLAVNGYAHEHKSNGMDVPEIKSSVVMSGLENPWDMAFLPDGTMFYTEKCKGLSVRSASGNITALYGMKGSEGYKDSGSDLFCEGQAGMLGVVADINFAKNRTLYVYSTSSKYYGSGCKTNFEKCNGNIVMRFKVSDDLMSVSDRTDIVTDIQYKPFEIEPTVWRTRRTQRRSHTYRARRLSLGRGRRSPPRHLPPRRQPTLRQGAPNRW